MKTYMLACSGYSAEKESDILIVKMDEKGQYQICNSYEQGANPSFCIRRGNYLYTVEEVDDGAAIRAWKIDGDRLETTDMRMEVPGAALCHLYAGERALFGSSYLTGDFFAADYALTEILWHRKPVILSHYKPENDRQECPHAHWTAQNGEELFLADLGSDRVWRYQLQEGLPGSALEPLVLEQEAGPRQPLPLRAGEALDEKELVLSIQELDSTLCLWKNIDGRFACMDKIRTTAAACDNFPGTICMASEDTVLVCNRGANTLAAVRVKDGHLQLMGEWETENWPRHLLRVGDSDLFVNSCDRAGKIIIFSWESEKLIRKNEISLTGASCAALL